MTTRILTRTIAILALSPWGAALAQPVVVVLDYGAAPRQALRYHYTAGETRQATMRMNMQMTIAMGENQMPAVSIPTIEVPMSIHTTEVGPDGSARYEFQMSDARLVDSDGGATNPALAQTLNAALGQIADMSGWARVDTRGQVLDTGYDLPPSSGLNAQIGQMLNSMQGQMQQMSAPFPAEAVGVGARWQLSATTQLMGIGISQVSEFTLLARDGDKVELGVAITQNADAQAAAAAVPGLPAEAQAALGNRKNEGSGKMTVDLDSTVPYSEMSTSTSMSMGAQLQGQTANISMNMQMKMSIQPD